MTPGLGLRGPDRHAPQKPGAKDWDIVKLGLPGLTGAGADLARHATVLNQGATSSCVANAWEGALLIEARNVGFKGQLAELGSRLFGYFNARAEHGSQYVDAGTYLRTYAYALKKVGRCPEKVWPFVKSRIDVRPTIAAYQQAHAMRGMRGYYRIYETGEDRLRAICAALEAGHPVVFGMRIDNAFKSVSGPTVVGVPAGTIIGGHAMCVVGYRLRSGNREFRILNSWGTSWRNGGYVWFNEELMTWSRLEDLWCTALL